MQSCKQRVVSVVDGTQYPPELDKEVLIIHPNNVIHGEDPYKAFKLSKSKEPFKVLVLQLAKMHQQS